MASGGMASIVMTCKFMAYVGMALYDSCLYSYGLGIASIVKTYVGMASRVPAYTAMA